MMYGVAVGSDPITVSAVGMTTVPAPQPARIAARPKQSEGTGVHWGAILSHS